MQYTILAADDETELIDALELYAERDGIKLLKADNGITALEIFRREKPHLVLLDIMMPGLDGFQVLRRIREESKVPAIMLTARGEDYDKILGLELGADDYITKPYNPLVVMARIKAQLRRNYDYHEETAPEKLTCGDVSLDPAAGTVTKGGSTVELTKTEYLILEYLLKNKGRILTKQQIFAYAWGDEFIADDSTVMVHISNLRAKIEDDPKSPKLLRTVKGLGYKAEKL
ncbi:response regulator transcription factor [uncultured Ruminococcus sp.]|uniref:response regulator transcription factor n=1 Tax=uncultured Ruminococcus sp. TaxID=165186 RepID=UPI0025FC72CA|nr:response regulator transcription factor [uncultured Ruminococcus sp.]